MTENMREGRAKLVRMTAVDHGYDLQRWHDHLKVLPRSESLGYSCNQTIALPKVMQAALASQVWQNAARGLNDQDDDEF